MSSACLSACSASRVSRRGSPGPALASQTSQGRQPENSNRTRRLSLPLSSHAPPRSRFMLTLAKDLEARLGKRRRHHRNGNARPPIAARLDDWRLCDRRHPRCVRSAGDWPLSDPVEIPLPNGRRVAFALAVSNLDRIGLAPGLKDAGDDPDVTHGAPSLHRLPRRARVWSEFAAGPGVGTVTSPACRFRPASPRSSGAAEMMRTLLPA